MMRTDLLPPAVEKTIAGWLSTQVSVRRPDPKMGEQTLIATWKNGDGAETFTNWTPQVAIAALAAIRMERYSRRVARLTVVIVAMTVAILGATIVQLFT